METQNFVHMTANEFADALLAAKPGTTFVYGQGDLASARYKARRRKDPKASELNLSANMAWEAHLTGKVCLTQKRIEANHYEYRATKRGRRA